MKTNTDTAQAVDTNTCVVYSHTFSNGTRYFGNGVSEKRAFNKGGRGKKYLEQFALDPNPVIQILATGLTPSEADVLEQKLFDEYVSSSGVKLQQRPSGKDLQKSIESSNSDAHKLAMNSPETREKIRIANTGKTHSSEHREKIRIANLGNTNGTRANCKVISMLDGRVTSHCRSSHWNKKNPDYFGTWVDL